MQRSNVDLPEPDAPMMVTTWPGMTSKLMSRSTSWLPNDLRRPSMRTMGSDATVCVMAYSSPSMVWSDVLPMVSLLTSKRLANLLSSHEASMVSMR